MKSICDKKNPLAQQVVFVDGQPGCGKSMFSSILQSFKRVEITNYCPEIELLCSIGRLDAIQSDALKVALQIHMDYRLYETMMSRNVNFRWSDVSSVIRSCHKCRYFLRLFCAGNADLEKEIFQKKPILHYSSHNLLSDSLPIFTALPKKVTFLHIIRHPLFMLKQQTLNKINLCQESPRQFRIFYKNNSDQSPYYYDSSRYGAFAKMSPIDQAIHEMKCFTDSTDTFLNEHGASYGEQILTIPFEQFVLNPESWIPKIEKILGTKTTPRTTKLLKKHKVPRVNLADGLDIKTYRRCGWQPPLKNSTNKEEIDQKWQYVYSKEPSKNSIHILKDLIHQYESKYYLNLNHL